jgi:hypothetical protein
LRKHFLVLDSNYVSGQNQVSGHQQLSFWEMDSTLELDSNSVTGQQLNVCAKIKILDNTSKCIEIVLITQFWTTPQN